jgi:transposase
VFSNQRHNRIKVLYFDGTGLWIMTKRLEQGTFSWPKGVDDQEGKMTLTPEALGLLSGRRRYAQRQDAPVAPEIENIFSDLLKSSEAVEIIW